MITIKPLINFVPETIQYIPYGETELKEFTIRVHRPSYQISTEDLMVMVYGQEKASKALSELCESDKDWFFPSEFYQAGIASRFPQLDGGEKEYEHFENQGGKYYVRGQMFPKLSSNECLDELSRNIAIIEQDTWTQVDEFATHARFAKRDIRDKEERKRIDRYIHESKEKLLALFHRAEKNLLSLLDEN